MSILHDELFENRSDYGHLANTDAGTVYLLVDYDAEELACRANIGFLLHFRDPCLNFD